MSNDFSELFPAPAADFDMKCPRCGASDEIDIAATVHVRLCRDGTDIMAASNGDHEWDDDSAAVCCACDYAGKVRDFSEPEINAVAACPVCAGEGNHIGDLGQRRHFRCRDCGIDFSSELPAAATGEPKDGAS
jgi:hypothetical protein